MLVTSIFSISHSIFFFHPSSHHLRQPLYLKSLTFSSICTNFNTLKKKKLCKNTVEKGEIAQNDQFHLFPPFSTMFCYAIFILKSFICHNSVVVWSLFQFGKVSKWCIRECIKLFTGQQNFRIVQILSISIQKVTSCYDVLYQPIKLIR